MKRGILFLSSCVIAFLLGFIANSLLPSAKGDMPGGDIIEQTKQYMVLELSSVDEEQYKCVIFDQNGGLLAEIDTGNICPIVENICPYMLSIVLNYGTGMYSTQYFDLMSRMISPRYDSVLAMKNGKVFYMAMDKEQAANKLIVCDAFQPNRYHKEYDLSFVRSATPVSAIADFEYEELLHITYAKEQGQGLEEASITIKLESMGATNF